jgi:hypothetical protein
MTAKDVYKTSDNILSIYGTVELLYEEYETIKAERDEMIKALIFSFIRYEKVVIRAPIHQDVKDNKKYYKIVTQIIERATGMTIDEAIKAYEEDNK